MRHLLPILLFAFPANSWCREIVFMKAEVNISELKKELELNSYEVGSISCYAGRCVLNIPDNDLRDPSPIFAAHVYVDPKIAEDSNKAAAIILLKKLRSSDLTIAELKELVGRLGFLVLRQ